MRKTKQPKAPEIIENPWSIVRRHMESKGITADEMARNGVELDQPITPKIAARLEFMVGKSAKFWAESEVLWKNCHARQ